MEAGVLVDRGRPGPSRYGWILPVALLVAASGCASTDVDAPVLRPPGREVAAYLLDPTLGPLEIGAEDRQTLREAWARMLRGDLAGAKESLSVILIRAPELEPARVLDAQIAFVEGRIEAARNAVFEVAAESPDSRAALMLLARTSELTGDPITAFVSYSAVDLEPAPERREALRDAAVQSAFGLLADALFRGRLDLAEEWLEWLENRAADDPLTVRGRIAFAEAVGDAEGALGALRELDAIGAAEHPDRQRLAELETERGDPQQGIELYTSMLTDHPGDPSLQEGLAAARFRFRMQMLPPGVGDAVLRPAVTRADFASLLYWLVPGIRGARPVAGVIVTDVPEEAERRSEIVRVVNLGLMELADPVLRRFEPDRTMRRGTGLRSVLGLPSHLGVELACAAPFERTPRPSLDRVCEVAVACGLVPSTGECLLGAELSGTDAATWLRRILELLD